MSVESGGAPIGADGAAARRPEVAGGDPARVERGSGRLGRIGRVSRALSRWMGGGQVVPLSLAAGVLLSALVGGSVAEAVQGPADTMPLSEVKPGMKGHGLTVFSGTTPERFDVEVISVLSNFRPNQDLVLIKTPNHPRLEAAKTVAGMSGSPIYLNNKMIGAYAYGWMFGSEAIAGVTPIKSMLEELARPIPRNLVPRGGSPLPSSSGAGGAVPQGPKKGARMFRGGSDRWALVDHARQLADINAPALAAPSGTSLMRASTPILLGGMTGVSMKMATDLLGPMGLEPVQAGGGRSSKPDPSAPAKFVDGGAIGVELVRGDVSAMGLGTVTRVSGDKMVAFGHPMLNGGIESLPTSVARVHWILATQNRSFKIGESVRSLGALVNDRQAAIVVDASVKAPTFPMKMTIEGVDGAPKPVWNMEVAHDQFMAPMFAAMGLGSAVETTTSERRDMTWRAISRLKVKGYGSMDFVDFGAGNGNPAGQDDFARGRLVRAMGMLLNNPWEDVTIEGVETRMKVTFAREIAMLRGAKVMEPEIDAGQPVRIRLEIQPYQGKIETRTLELMLPNELAGKEVEIEIQPGYQVEKPLPTPDSVAELVAVLPQQSFDPESLVLTYRLKDAGATYKNKLATRLPPSALDTLRPSSDSDAPETFGSLVQTAFPMKRFIVGRDTVRVEVRPVLR